MLTLVDISIVTNKNGKIGHVQKKNFKINCKHFLTHVCNKKWCSPIKNQRIMLC